MSIGKHTKEHAMLRMESSLVGASAPANTCVLLGDSITLRNHLSDGGTASGDFKPAPSTGVIDTTYKSFQWTGWFHWANAFLYQRFEVVAYSGVAGNTCAQMLARLSTDVLAFSPKYCFVQVSANGIATGLTAAAELASVQSIVRQLKNAGIIPIVSKMVFSSSVSQNAEADEWTEFNFDLMQWLRANDVIAVDLMKGMGDVAHLAAVKIHDDYSNDNVHPNVNGAARMGLNCYDQLKNIIPESHIFPAWITDYKTGVRNPVQNGTSGTVTGTGASGVSPDQWVLKATQSNNETIVGAKVARTDLELGEWIELTFGGSPTIANYESFDYTPTVVTIANSGFATGDTISSYVEMEVTTAIVNLQPPRLRGFFSAGGHTPTFDKIQLFGALDGNVVGVPFLMRLPDTTIGTQTGTDTSNLTFDFYTESVAAISGVIKFGAAWMQKRIT